MIMTGILMAYVKEKMEDDENARDADDLLDK